MLPKLTTVKSGISRCHTDYPADAGDRAAAVLRHPGQDPSEVRQLERLQAAARTPLRVQLAAQAPDGKVPHPGGTHRQEMRRAKVIRTEHTKNKSPRNL